MKILFATLAVLSAYLSTLFVPHDHQVPTATAIIVALCLTLTHFGRRRK